MAGQNIFEQVAAEKASQAKQVAASGNIFDRMAGEQRNAPQRPSPQQMAQEQEAWRASQNAPLPAHPIEALLKGDLAWSPHFALPEMLQRAKRTIGQTWDTAKNQIEPLMQMGSHFARAEMGDPAGMLQSYRDVSGIVHNLAPPVFDALNAGSGDRAAAQRTWQRLKNTGMAAGHELRGVANLDPTAVGKFAGTVATAGLGEGAANLLGKGAALADVVNTGKAAERGAGAELTYRAGTRAQNEMDTMQGELKKAAASQGNSVRNSVNTMIDKAGSTPTTHLSSVAREIDEAAAGNGAAGSPTVKAAQQLLRNARTRQLTELELPGASKGMALVERDSLPMGETKFLRTKLGRLMAATKNPAEKAAIRAGYDALTNDMRETAEATGGGKEFASYNSVHSKLDDARGDFLHDLETASNPTEFHNILNGPMSQKIQTYLDEAAQDWGLNKKAWGAAQKNLSRDMRFIDGLRRGGFSGVFRSIERHPLIAGGTYLTLGQVPGLRSWVVRMLAAGKAAEVQDVIEQLGLPKGEIGRITGLKPEQIGGSELPPAPQGAPAPPSAPAGNAPAPQNAPLVERRLSEGASPTGLERRVTPEGRVYETVRGAKRPLKIPAEESAAPMDIAKVRNELADKRMSTQDKINLVEDELAKLERKFGRYSPSNYRQDHSYLSNLLEQVKGGSFDFEEVPPPSRAAQMRQALARSRAIRAASHARRPPNI